MSLPLQIVIAMVIFLAGAAGGVKYHAGMIAKRDLAAERLIASDKVQQRKFSDVASGKHAGALSKLSTQLGDARAHIANLSDRPCLSARTVGVLNAIGEQPGGAATSEPAGASEAVATARDVSTFIAACRAQYGEVSSQINQILDIEDRRHPPGQ
ncbi:MAG TPA: hypothetical protein VE934_11915 [Polaromonas sp.]|uniref:hypothetical protein n=1 Tax=Polaromonas sp. TaxID=1869339 RepID=UPI002D2F73FD|nr:hypothetical protein [Polaromonas sp.]HYW57661.1 hypothetical protein [Polaromonas sp.]